jgi:hypothetical protein
MPGSMFSEVVDWFLSRVGDRRQYKRREGAFHVWYAPRESTPVQGIGTEISPNGLLFVMESPIPQQEFELAVGLRNKRFPVRVKVVRRDSVDYRGKPWNRYACEFTGIAADWWDMIVRYVNDEPEVADRRHQQNQEMGNRVDDAYRLLPMALQKKIVDMLVAKHRLEEPKPGQSPLLKLFYGGMQKAAEGRPAMHRFNVHSRIVVNDEPIAYDTRFLIGEDGSIQMQ